MPAFLFIFVACEAFQRDEAILLIASFRDRNITSYAILLEVIIIRRNMPIFLSQRYANLLLSTTAIAIYYFS